MTQLIQRVGANGLQLPKELIEQWGAREGQEVNVATNFTNYTKRETADSSNSCNSWQAKAQFGEFV